MSSGNPTIGWNAYNDKVTRCKGCVMPAVQGRYELDDDGFCMHCRTRGAPAASQEPGSRQQASFQSRTPEERERIFLKKVSRYRSGSSYDCVVAVSGGKDSLGAWYLARKLGLRTLGVFIDNGFALPEMYDNIRRAADILESDVMVYRTNELKKLFTLLLSSRKPIYYCHVCHMLLDNCIKKVAEMNGVRLVLGGYTKGQGYLKQDELDWVFEITDRNVAEVLEGHEEFDEVRQAICDPFRYAMERYRDIMEISPYKYLAYDEEELVRLVKDELHYQQPLESWPAGSTNCLFNYVSQYLAVKQFGYSQHETELSEMVRLGEMPREHALQTICTNITEEQLRKALAPLDDALSVDVITSQMETARSQDDPVLGRPAGTDIRTPRRTSAASTIGHGEGKGQDR